MPFRGLFKSSNSESRSHRALLRKKDEQISPIPPPAIKSKPSSLNYLNTLSKIIDPPTQYDTDDSIDFTTSNNNHYHDDYNRNYPKKTDTHSYSDSYDSYSRNSISYQDSRYSRRSSYDSLLSAKNGNSHHDIHPGDRSKHHYDLQSTDSASFHSTEEKLPILDHKDHSVHQSPPATYGSTLDPRSTAVASANKTSNTSNAKPAAISSPYSKSRSKTSSYSDESLEDEYRSNSKQYSNGKSSKVSSKDGSYPSSSSTQNKSSNESEKPKNGSRNHSHSSSNNNTAALSHLNPGYDSRNGISSPQKSGRIHSRTSLHQRNLSTSSVPSPPKKETLGLKRFLKKFKVKEKGSILPSSKSSELFKKYGTLGKLLGTGASGSVNLVTSKADGSIYAVKKFRPKLSSESERDYSRKVRNEFKIGARLNHENLIYTKELIEDHPNKSKLSNEVEFYIVMEYCQYDFFDLVMSGLMDPNEVACYFKQIIDGVAFLHKHSLAHRDLKLDNCVVNEWGQLKLIDFGSAVQFKKPDQNRSKNGLQSTQSFTSFDSQESIAYALGIVGSDPYLAPEVFDCTEYDPRLADVWSIAIIYCCMILKRFPWKIPKQSDASFRSFLELDDGIHSTVSNLSLTANSANGSKSHPRGPDRLLRLLPAPSRKLIGAMLIINPKRRYLVEDILEDQFYLDIDHCHSIGDDKYYTADNHTHHLVKDES